MIIPVAQFKDDLVWSCNDSGTLSLKEAYSMMIDSSMPFPWGKIIWNKVVPPSKSFLIWRIIHGKFPIDDMLRLRCCHMVSIISLCRCDYETSDHLFLQCKFASKMLNWLGDFLSISVDTSYIISALNLCQRRWSSLMQDVVLSGIANTLWFIWFSRNKARFYNKTISI